MRDLTPHELAAIRHFERAETWWRRLRKIERYMFWRCDYPSIALEVRAAWLLAWCARSCQLEVERARRALATAA